MTELANAYFRWLNADATNEWAQDRVDAMFSEDAEKAWLLVLDLLESAPSKHNLYYVAAGQLEMLIRDEGLQFTDRIREEASKNKRLLYALTGVWLDEANPAYPECMSILRENISPGFDVEQLVDLPQDLRKKFKRAPESK